jgi:hypothetical protein
LYQRESLLIEEVKGLDVDLFMAAFNTATGTGAELHGGLKVLYRMVQHVAVFPFQPVSTEKVDQKGFIRSLFIFSKRIHLAHGQKSRGELGRYYGKYVSRERSTFDTRRMLFRALAVPGSSNHDTSNRMIPVTNFQYDTGAGMFVIQHHVPLRALPYVYINRNEDERFVDARDVLGLHCLAYQKGIPRGFMDLRPTRSNYDEALQSLPVYEHYLDELIVPWRDLLELTQILLLLQFTPKSQLGMDWFPAYLNQEAKSICKFVAPPGENIGWQLFNDSIFDEMVSSNSCFFMTPLIGS